MLGHVRLSPRILEPGDLDPNWALGPWPHPPRSAHKKKKNTAVDFERRVDHDACALPALACARQALK